MHEFMFWSGVVAWVALWMMGICFAIDRIAGHCIDSVRFKIWLVKYLREQETE